MCLDIWEWAIRSPHGVSMCLDVWEWAIRSPHVVSLCHDRDMWDEGVRSPHATRHGQIVVTTIIHVVVLANESS